MRDSRLRKALVLGGLAVALGLAGCRPTGDFGRAAPSVVHDEALPRIGALAARGRKEAVSGFVLTDDERELRDRAWSFVRAPHVRDWWREALAEGQRTRLLPILEDADPADGVWAVDNPLFPWLPILAAPGDHTRYYAFLASERFASSEPRWTRMIADIDADAALVPPFCAVALRVGRADDERLAVLDRQMSGDPLLIADARARVAENAGVVDWVWQALRYRLDSYRFAIDRLQIETPSRQLWAANRAIGRLAGQGCDGAPGTAAGPGAGVRRPSRLLKMVPSEATVPQK